MVTAAIRRTPSLRRVTDNSEKRKEGRLLDREGRVRRSGKAKDPTNWRESDFCTTPRKGSKHAPEGTKRFEAQIMPQQKSGLTLAEKKKKGPEK